jgi:hypothetical protein
VTARIVSQVLMARMWLRSSQFHQYDERECFQYVLVRELSHRATGVDHEVNGLGGHQ